MTHYPLIMRSLLVAFAFLGCALAAAATNAPPRDVYVISNFHPASCGWLTDWSTERNYCANSYLDHLDRVREDATYNFALSECNNMIAIQNFQPERFAELKERVKQGRVELCNAFFLEPTINLSGGEALVKMGVEGLRWQQQVMGVRPRISWMIDVTGMHEQMPQIVSGLGLDALVYCRMNPTGSTLHWMESPDGTRTLAVSPGHYLEWRPMFGAKTPMTEKQMQALAEDVRVRIEPLPAEKNRLRPDAGDLKGAPRKTPEGAPVLILGGSGDYSLAPFYKNYPAEFLQQFKKVAPEYTVKFTTPSKYLDAVMPGLKSGQIKLPTLRGGMSFTYAAFWIQNPEVKSSYRRCEQLLQGAEMLATAASIRGKFEYPVQPLNGAWLEMMLNMDRNTLWGAAGGMVFEHARSWDVRDRFNSVEKISRNTSSAAIHSLLGEGKSLALFNPLNWKRNDPVRLVMPAEGTPNRLFCQKLPGCDDALVRFDLPAAGLSTVELAAKAAKEPEAVALPAAIETRHYRLVVDPKTGSLTSLKLKVGGREMLAGPANVVVAEQPKKKIGNSADHMVDRPDRVKVADSTQSTAKLTVHAGQVATVVTAESSFIGGGRLRRMMICYNDYPRIDFETELNDIPDKTVIVAEFPLASDVREIRRGVPYGFSHAAWPQEGPRTEELRGWAKGITPAVRWSHYQMEGAGVALLDQGLSGREIIGNTPVIYLYNAAEKYRGYPNAWLSGAGRHVVRYALVAHAGDSTKARIPQMAWEFNNPPTAISGAAATKPVSLLQTSDNVIVEAMRREGNDIEVRLAECIGRAGNATVTLNLPHADAAITDMMGGNRKALKGGSTCHFPVRPQQIVTLRFRTQSPVAEVKPLLAWDEFVPEKKREALKHYLPDVKGHPPAADK